MRSYRRSFTWTFTTVSSIVGTEEIIEMDEGPSSDAQEMSPSTSSSNILPKWRVVNENQESPGTITPDSEPRTATLLTENGPLEVCIVKSKAISESNGKFRCPVPKCNYGSHSRLRITKHFRDDHKNYRSWRDVFLRKDAPHFILKKDKEEKASKSDEAVSSTSMEEAPLAGNDNPLESLQRLVETPNKETPMEESFSKPCSPPTERTQGEENNLPTPPVQAQGPPPPQPVFLQPIQQPGQFIAQPGFPCPMIQTPQGLIPQVQPTAFEPSPQYRVIQVLVPSRLVQSGTPGISISPSPERPYHLLPVQKVGSTLVPQMNEPRIVLNSPHQTIPVVTPNPGYVPVLPSPQAMPVYPIYNSAIPSNPQTGFCVSAPPQIPPQEPPPQQ